MADAPVGVDDVIRKGTETPNGITLRWLNPEHVGTQLRQDFGPEDGQLVGQIKHPHAG